MQEGDVVLAPVPQADGKIKHRPAIALREMPRYRDFLVCGVSTQLQQWVEGFDELIDAGDDDFALSGLLQSSVIRLGFLAVLPSVTGRGHDRQGLASTPSPTPRVVGHLPSPIRRSEMNPRL